jgi:hypothetical protein
MWSLLRQTSGQLRFQVLTAANMKLAVFCVVTPCSLVEVYRRFIALMMKAASTSETSVNFYHTTQCKTQKTANLKHQSSDDEFCIYDCRVQVPQTQTCVLRKTSRLNYYIVIEM